MTNRTFAPAGDKDKPTPPPPPAEEETKEAPVEPEVLDKEEPVPDGPPVNAPPDEGPAMKGDDKPDVDVDEMIDSPGDEPPGESFNLPAPADLTQTSGFLGEHDDQDFSLARLNLAQKIGDLGEVFEPGSFVYNQEVLLAEYDRSEKKLVPEKIDVVILLAEKFYQESIDWESDQEARLFKTKEEVKNAGGGFNKGDEPRFFPGLRLLLLIKAPDPENFDHDIYNERVNGEPWAMATYVLRKSAYFEAGVKISQLAKRRDGDGNPIHLSTHKMQLGVKVKRIKENNIFIPSFTVVGENEPGTIKQIAASL